MSVERSIIEQVGGQRFISDKRQFAGLLFGLGLAAVFQPLADVASLIGPDGTTVTTGIPFSSLFAGLTVIFFGILAVIVGYLQLVHDWGSKYLTGLAICSVQLAYISYFTNITAVGRAAKTGAAFIPATLNPTAGDVKFVGAMGIISVFTYGFTFAGSVAFMEFALLAYQNGKQSDRGGVYFFGRMSFYTVMLTLAGLSQLMLGSYIFRNFGSGPFPDPIGVAVYVVSYPAISVFVGLVQFINGIWGVARSIFGFHWGPDDVSYPTSLAFQWLCIVVLQVITQISYPPAAAAAANAPGVACISLGLCVMPAFLDHKMRNLPAELDEDFYGAEPETAERESLNKLRQSVIAKRSGSKAPTHYDSTEKELDDKENA